VIEQSFSEVFASALDGAPTVVVGLGGDPVALPVHLWRQPADRADLELVALCDGPTLDIGCGPGRLTEALATHGHIALGIDVVPAAVAMTAERGVPAMQRDVFDRLPGEGRWHTALLADGNIGIGGDPHRLLRRCRRLVRPGGSVLAELAPPGSVTWSGPVRLRVGEAVSLPFAWAAVASDDVVDVAHRAGLGVATLWTEAGRWFAHLVR
jgi:SAM-dependent methyltransferase